MDKKIKDEIRKLRDKANIAFVGSVNGENFPQVKAMLVFEHDDLRIQYFSTNLSSKRCAQFRENPKACVYYCNEAEYKGALFTGTIEICEDRETRAMLWRDGCEIYYPGGIDDPDYCVYKFIAETVNFYCGLSNITTSIDELYE